MIQKSGRFESEDFGSSVHTQGESLQRWGKVESQSLLGDSFLRMPWLEIGAHCGLISDPKTPTEQYLECGEYRLVQVSNEAHMNKVGKGYDREVMRCQGGQPYVHVV